MAIITSALIRMLIIFHRSTSEAKKYGQIWFKNRGFLLGQSRGAKNYFFAILCLKIQSAH
jgi:hypothetical protein